MDSINRAREDQAGQFHQFDGNSSLSMYAYAERARSLAARRGESEGFMRGTIEVRNYMYEKYTKTPHPSTLKGGSV